MARRSITVRRDCVRGRSCPELNAVYFHSSAKIEGANDDLDDDEDDGDAQIPPEKADDAESDEENDDDEE